MKYASNSINVGHCVVSVLLQFTGSDCPLGIFKLLLYGKIYIRDTHSIFQTIRFNYLYL